jgi:hypothetical protein
MFLLDGIKQILQTLESQLVNIPTNNGFAVAYVILNAALLVLALIFSGGITSDSSGIFGSLFGGK